MWSPLQVRSMPSQSSKEGMQLCRNGCALYQIRNLLYEVLVD